jgi:ABC-2 type transport system ATP-binding protein
MKFPSPSSAEAVVSVSELSRRFGEKVALDNVSIYVPKGTVFGLIGENGAGKTTLIKHILGLLAAESGTVRVFGSDPTSDPVRVLGRIGYLSEQPDVPGWMQVQELIRYMKAFYPKWDSEYATTLLKEFGLNPAQRISTLSKGQTAKASLLVAQAHRPELLLLDEPSSGLDPMVRRDILEAVIRTVADEGRTVFFSSHFLDEIERVSDHIAMLHEGKLILCGSLDDLKGRHRVVRLRFRENQTKPPEITGALGLTGANRDWTCLYAGSNGEWQTVFSRQGGQIVDEHSPTLHEIFVAYAGGSAL